MKTLVNKSCGWKCPRWHWTYRPGLRARSPMASVDNITIASSEKKLNYRYYRYIREDVRLPFILTFLVARSFVSIKEAAKTVSYSTTPVVGIVQNDANLHYLPTSAMTLKHCTSRFVRDDGRTIYLASPLLRCVVRTIGPGTTIHCRFLGMGS